MAAFLALFFVALIAVSQAAPRPQSDVNSQQTAANPSPPAVAPGATSNLDPTAANPGASSTSSGTATPAGSYAIIIPSQLLSTLFPSITASGTQTSSTSGGSAGSPLATIISLIPTAINQERDRFGNAVETLVQTNTAAIGDMIDSAAATGGKFLSNGVRLVGAWPTFFGNLIG